jgi:Tfp pilus assembly protein PilE
MAGSKLNGRVKASTVLEVIISMIIIVVVFGIAMMIYTNVLRLSLSAKKIRAQALLQETMLNAERNTGNTNQSLTVDDFRIEQEVTPYNSESNLTAIHLTVYDQNQQKVAELQKVIINQP